MNDIDKILGYHASPQLRKRLEGYIAQECLEARIKERKTISLDNYHGHTFSDATNYKYKFDKFIESNERCLERLTYLQNREKQ